MQVQIKCHFIAVIFAKNSMFMSSIFDLTIIIKVTIFHEIRIKVILSIVFIYTYVLLLITYKKYYIFIDILVYEYLWYFKQIFWFENNHVQSDINIKLVQKMIIMFLYGKRRNNFKNDGLFNFYTYIAKFWVSLFIYKIFIFSQLTLINKSRGLKLGYYIYKLNLKW